MDPTIWGPHYWFMLHTMAFHYPKHPTSIQKKIYYRFVHHLHEFIPNPSIASQFQKIIKENPVTPYLDERADFIKWMHHIHNIINRRLDKDEITLSEHYEEFSKNFESSMTKLQRFNKEKWKLFFLLFCCMIGIWMFKSIYVK
jgi:hypothetical protein